LMLRNFFHEFFCRYLFHFFSPSKRQVVVRRLRLLILLGSHVLMSQNLHITFPHQLPFQPTL
jgi:hypothetical protein